MRVEIARVAGHEPLPALCRTGLLPQAILADAAAIQRFAGLGRSRVEPGHVQVFGCGGLAVAIAFGQPRGLQQRRRRFRLRRGRGLFVEIARCGPIVQAHLRDRHADQHAGPIGVVRMRIQQLLPLDQGCLRLALAHIGLGYQHLQIDGRRGLAGDIAVHGRDAVGVVAVVQQDTGIALLIQRLTQGG